MRVNLRCALLLTVLVLSSIFVRPASAQTPTPREVASFVLEGISAGHFKCDIYTTIFQLLQVGASAECPRRAQLFAFARDCACKLSREIDMRPNSPTFNQPFQTLGPGIFDLAGFWHTVPAQTYGRTLCALLTVLAATTCLL